MNRKSEQIRQGKRGFLGQTVDSGDRWPVHGDLRVDTRVNLRVLSDIQRKWTARIFPQQRRRLNCAFGLRRLSPALPSLCASSMGCYGVGSCSVAHPTEKVSSPGVGCLVGSACIYIRRRIVENSSHARRSVG